MWGFQVRVESSKTPRNLTSFSSVIFLFPILILIFLWGMFEEEWKRAKCDLSTFSANLFVVNHLSTFFSSLFMVYSKRSRLSDLKYILVSSAKRQNLSFLQTAGKSLMKMRNNSGPKTEPCGTPHITSSTSDDAPFTSTYCFLLVKYDWNQLKGIPLSP